MRNSYDMARDWCKQRVSPRQRARRAKIASAFTPPTELKRSSRRLGTVWGVSMVKNEADVIRASVLHQLSQGIDAVIVADNGSTDGTVEILEDLAAEYPVHVARDALTAHFQGEKMTGLAALARISGADWILPFDADEFWFAAGASVADSLRHTAATVIRAVVHNVFPLAPISTIDVSTPLRLDLSPSEHGKVAFRGHHMARLGDGNHDVVRSGARADGLYVALLPWRSLEQLTRKVDQGAVALDAGGLGPNRGAHWRGLSRKDAAERSNLWASLLEGTGDTMAWHPVGPFIVTPVLSWATWPAQPHSQGVP